MSKFRLTGRISKGGKFMVHMVYAVDWHPFLKPREVGHLVQSLNAAAKVQVEMPVSSIKKGMIQDVDMSDLPRRRLRLGQGT